MSSSYCGSFYGKDVARNIAHDAMFALCPTHYTNSHHLYLAGTEAGDLQEASDRGVSHHNLHAVEANYSSFFQAQSNNKKSGLDSRIFYADLLNYARASQHKYGIIFIDVCGIMETTVPLIKGVLPKLEKGGIIALNFTYGRDGWGNARAEKAYQLSTAFRRRFRWTCGRKPLAAALLASELFNVDEGIRLFFPLAMSYRNNVHPMLTLVGRSSATGATTEPGYYIRLSGENCSRREFGESNHPKLPSYKAHLPTSFKSWWGSLTK